MGETKLVNGVEMPVDDEEFDEFQQKILEFAEANKERFEIPEEMLEQMKAARDQWRAACAAEAEGREVMRKLEADLARATEALIREQTAERMKTAKQSKSRRFPH